MKQVTVWFTIFIVACTTCFAQPEFDVLNTGTNNTFVASSFINNDEGWLADNQGNLWHTIDAGQSWATIFSGTKFYQLDFTDVSNGFALDAGQAFKTIDGGTSWEAISLDNAGSALYFIDKNTGFISGFNEIYKTTDAGVTWMNIATGVRSFVDYYFINETFGVAAASDFSNTASLWRTIDGGLTWKNVFDDAHYFMSSVWFTSETIGWAAGYFSLPGSTHEPVILKTADGGETWESSYDNQEVMGIGETFIDIRFKNENEGFAISDLNVNMLTTDGGQTWLRSDEEESLEFPVNDSYYKSLAGNSEMYITGENGYLVRWK